MVFKIFLFLFLPLICFAEVGFVEPWGKNAGLRFVPREKATTPEPTLSPMGWLATQAILFHQNVLTHIDGPRSHFRPSSSQYMKLAIQKHGFFKGFIMGCDRLLRENEDPWIYRTILHDGKVYKWDAP